MLCDDCKKNLANMRVVSVVNGQRSVKNLCAQCAARQGIEIPAAATEQAQRALTALLSSLRPSAPRQYPGLVCTHCGTTYDAFLASGRLGCPGCYRDFRAQIEPLLVRLHGRARHLGRVPEHAGERAADCVRIERIRREMDLAVACEDFETAALLRDEMKALVSACADGTGEET